MSDPAPKVGVVDIGTNSMRLLITGPAGEVGRWVEVTGLGRGVDATGTLAADAIARTVDALSRFGEIMTANGVSHRAAMATSATRDASNRELFLALAAAALGVMPDMISGDREGRLSYAGAVSDLAPGDYLVSDIGGGSTEFVTANASVSIDIGSVRLTDRILPARPAPASSVAEAREHVLGLFDGLGGAADEVIGVAGTWTSLAALDLEPAQAGAVHHHRLARPRLDGLVRRLSGLTVEETAEIPALDPARAPVILAGAVVAACVAEVIGVDHVTVAEKDSLDGLAAELLDLA